ncbi:SYNEM protein, partial [Alaudala cheleensis]|nr:SYNEM protein [Alaudala cheleensis]
RALLEGESKPWIIWREEIAGELREDIINSSYNYTDTYSTYQERNRNKALPAARITDTRHRMPVTNMSSSAHYSAHSAASHTTTGGRTLGRDLLGSTYRPSTTLRKDERILTDHKELRTFTPDYSSWRSTETQQKRIPERKKTEVTTSSTVSFSKESARTERSDKDHKPDAENTRSKPGFTRFPAYELITDAKPSKYEETIIETRTILKDKTGGSKPTDEKTSLLKEKDKLEKQAKDEKKKRDEKSLIEESVDYGRKTEQRKYIREEVSQKVTGSDTSTARTLKSESAKRDATSESRSKDVIEVPITIERPAPDKEPQRNKEIRVHGVKTSIGRETDEHITQSAETHQVRISEAESSLEEQMRDGSHKMGTLPTEDIAENIVTDILKSFTQSSSSQMSTDAKVTHFDKKKQEDEGKIKTEFTVQSQVQGDLSISEEGD